MYSLLLVIIYAAFISLGLPDSLLGSAWPVMHEMLGVPVSWAGLVTMIISAGTIISSLFSDWLTRKFGAGPVTAVSVLMTAAALFGFSISSEFWMLCLWAIPYGLGAGAVDAALNNYVALHYSSRDMSWLHCFWGVGTIISPYIMSHSLMGGLGWQQGYRTVSLLQLGLTAVLFLSLSVWKKAHLSQQAAVRAVKEAAAEGTPAVESAKPLTLLQALQIRGVWLVLIAFFSYCALEQTTMLWASSFLVQSRGIDASVAARFASMFCIGITAGRFLCGFVADRMGDKRMIRLGTLVVFLGIVLVAVPVQMDQLALAGLIVIGFGCAPIYPSIIHATPDHFGRENSQAIIGIQMACAYVGTTLMPPLFGVLSSVWGIGLFAGYLFLFALLMLAASERLNYLEKKRRRR
ncbi:MAG TPA: MFS transporter [Candidatus Eisenbergiella merdipullorum]|uniref:MFS transporter n=1 Tax=Candidatus Eisenbergiella merdipullorum TaxID=2838553 RepID=A0A9D2I4E8_9FIRM|nr:MFS transporter [Candidatus Eisenbergiella merdipullorum]